MRWELEKSYGVSFFFFFDVQSYSFDSGIPGLLRACEMLEPECLVHLLKAVKHLSMNATLLEVLQNANGLEILIRILDEQSSGPHSTVSLLFLTSGKKGHSIVGRKCQITFSKRVIISVD